MKTSYQALLILVALTLTIPMIGCGGGKPYKLATVSGTVTLDGEPVANAEVYFEPQPVDDNINVGPSSIGTTDSQGKFTLTTRFKEEGAVVGPHKVFIQYAGFDPEAEDAAKAAMQEAKQDKEDEGGAKSDLSAAKKQKKIPLKYSDEGDGMDATVESGDNNFDFPLNTK